MNRASAGHPSGLSQNEERETTIENGLPLQRPRPTVNFRSLLEKLTDWVTHRLGTAHHLGTAH